MVITENSMMLQLSEISEGILKMKRVDEENKSLKQKLKLLREDRNSDFWLKIE
jgi:hypothetical protein